LNEFDFLHRFGGRMSLTENAALLIEITYVEELEQKIAPDASGSAVVVD
jgi:hypothetical protein